MQIAIDVAGFTPTEADELRQAMGAKRSGERMARLRDRLFAGMAARDVGPEVAEQVYTALAAFANFGFPESHSVAFAHLVYATAWFKVHYPVAFTAGLLNAQPMGFWSPQSLVADAKRHGVEVRRPDVDRSRAGACIEWDGPRDGPGPALRLGLSAVRGVGSDAAERIAAGRPWAGMEDLVRRAGVTRPQLESLATAGALDGRGTPAVGTTVGRWCGRPVPPPRPRPDRLAGIVTGADPPPLPPPGPWEEVADDLWSLGHGPGHHRHGTGPTGAGRPAGGGRRRPGDHPPRDQDHRGRGGDPPPAARERPRGRVRQPRGRDRHGQRRLLAGRVGPVEAGGRGVPALLVRGRLERAEGAINLIAERIEPLELGPVPASRDFR